MTQRVDIFGAGLAGLTASLHLARKGFEVHLHDRENRIGGNPLWHPSVQTTTLDLNRTSEYVGVDLFGYFKRIDSIIFYRYGRKNDFTLPNMYACERGPRESSLDVHLAKLAQDAGVDIHLNVELSIELISSKANCILATGLDESAYRLLGITHVPLFGYRSLAHNRRNGLLLSYMLPCTNYDFAYVAGMHDLLFGLLFSRDNLNNLNLFQFERTLLDTENIGFAKWIFSQGAMPVRPLLKWKDKVLAGTLSGMIDPFLLHGVSGAMTSGKIAAQYFFDSQGAQNQFRHLSRNFHLQLSLKKLAAKLPFKSVSTPILMWMDAHLSSVGFV